MLRVELYEVLNKKNLKSIVCKKEELKKELNNFEKQISLKKDTLIIQICKEKYKIYYTENEETKGNELIQLDLAMQFRVELDILELEQRMLDIDKVIIEYPFDVITDKYCLVRYMDLQDTFLILDVYVGVKEINV